MNTEIGKETGTLRIKLNGLKPDQPVTFKYPSLKVSITWDEHGEADVPTVIARKLLSPAFKNYEEVKVSGKSEEPIPEGPVHKTTRSLKVDKD